MKEYLAVYAGALTWQVYGPPTVLISNRRLHDGMGRDEWAIRRWGYRKVESRPEFNGEMWARPLPRWLWLRLCRASRRRWHGVVRFGLRHGLIHFARDDGSFVRFTRDVRLGRG